MNSEPLIGIVIVNYNGAKFQNDCLKSLFDCGYANFKIIIVDNASSDNSMELLKEFNDDRIVVIFNSENLGVAAGNNIGIQKSRELGCDYTMLLNNDTVMTKGFINLLLSDNENIAVPKIYYYGSDKVLWYGGGTFVKWKGTSVHLNYKIKDEGIKFEKYYDYAPTCCALIKNSVFDTVGMMDEKYFLYFDDTDWMYRAKQCGYKLRFYEDAVIYHKVSMSTGGEHSPISLYYSNRNRFYFIDKFKFGFIPKMFVYWSRKIKILLSKIKGDGEWRYIKEAMKDYKCGNMYRKDNLKEIAKAK